MRHWLALDARLAGARNEAGFVRPESLDYVLERDYGITDASECRVAADMLAMIAIGRNEGAYGEDEEIEEKPSQTSARRD